jgi:putative FmdB family regulatory protein
MPTYDYKCPDCGCETEANVRLDERRFARVHCPDCGTWMTRQPSAPAIAFKGSGFYVNDYKRKT